MPLSAIPSNIFSHEQLTFRVEETRPPIWEVPYGNYKVDHRRIRTKMDEREESHRNKCSLCWDEGYDKHRCSLCSIRQITYGVVFWFSLIVKFHFIEINGVLIYSIFFLHGLIYTEISKLDNLYLFDT